MKTLEISKTLIGDQIQDRMFGGNFLAFRDRLGEGTYDDVAELLNLQSARFPGGSVAEELFDIRDPDQTSLINHLNGEVVERLSLTEFLDWCANTSTIPSIVIPTRHALEGNDYGNRSVSNQAVLDLKVFISDLLNGTYGPANALTLEVGNEYWGSGQMTALEYGRVASEFSLAIQEEIDAFKASNPLPDDWLEPKIAVQIGQAGEASPGSIYGSSDDQNDDVIAEFNMQEAAAVDAVIGHYYARNGFEAVDTNEWVFRRLDEWSNDSRFGDIEHHMTEWNVSARQADEYGLEHASMIFHIVAEFVERGVDSAVVWPLQQNTPTSLSWNEGTSDLTFAGEAFRLLGENVIGSNLTWKSISADFGGFLYETEQHKFLVLASHSDSVQQVEFNMDSIGTDLEGGLLTRLSSFGATDDYNLTPQVQTTHVDLSASPVISASLDPFEIAFFEFSSAGFGFEWSGQHSSGNHPGISFEDNLIGTEFADTFHGRAGNDNLQGAGGNDILTGGRGDDVIDGGDGSDIIDAGEGDDLVFGGNGQDEVYLGAGNDRFEDNWQASPWGNDSIYGGDGDDFIFARAGDDIVLGENGDDHLEGGIGNDDVHGGHGDDRLEGNDGRDELYGDEGEDLLLGGNGFDRLFGGADNDALYGGKGNDVLKGEDGDDTLHGEAGADLLLGGEGNDTLYGNWGEDELFGYGGDDILKGGQLDDHLFGGLGDDLLNGGEGDDVLNGGAGSDVFVFKNDGSRDRVSDFNWDVDNDRLALDDFDLIQSIEDVRAAAVDTSTGILIDLGTQIEVDGLFVSSLHVDMFIF